LTKKKDLDKTTTDKRLLSRRSFIRASYGTAFSMSGASLISYSSLADSAGDYAPTWMKNPGLSLREYGSPSTHETHVVKTVLKRYGDLAPGAGVGLTPLQHLKGTITPNSLHFERSHNGVPEIDPKQHKILIHGLVERPLVFSVDDILQYPMESRQCFIECSGNSFFNSKAFPEPQQLPVSNIHGLVSCSEWTGVPLSLLLKEAGVRSTAKWIVAEGADAVAMSRSIPLEKALDDTIVALYQNSERIRPEQGYPLRLVLPGYEGNMSVKWLRRIKITDKPMHTKDETSKYTELLPDGKARQFTFFMGVKSILTQPATGLALQGPGQYELNGLAWSGHGKVTKVEISVDDGRSWVESSLCEPVLSKCLTRFKMPWHWDGSSVVLQSRAYDDKGNIQPNRMEWSKQYGAGQSYHCNAIQSWQINSDGSVTNIYL
jgi:sulfane dehydrogenase subunit SoxC